MERTRSLREEQSFAAIVARAFEWPPQATLVHGFLMSSSIAPVPVSSDESRFVRIFCAQCPSTRAVVHLEVHTEFSAPSLAAFAVRAADALADWQRRSTQGPMDDIPMLKGRYLRALDVREQFPLWPFPHPHPLVDHPETQQRRPRQCPGLIAIADKLGVDHGREVGSDVPYVASLDLLVTLKRKNGMGLAGIALKPHELILATVLDTPLLKDCLRDIPLGQVAHKHQIDLATLRSVLRQFPRLAKQRQRSCFRRKQTVHRSSALELKRNHPRAARQDLKTLPSLMDVSPAVSRNTLLKSVCKDCSCNDAGTRAPLEKNSMFPPVWSPISPRSTTTCVAA